MQSVSTWSYFILLDDDLVILYICAYIYIYIYMFHRAETTAKTWHQSSQWKQPQNTLNIFLGTNLKKMLINHYFHCVEYGWQKLHKHYWLHLQQLSIFGHTAGPFNQNLLPTKSSFEGADKWAVSMPFQISAITENRLKRQNDAQSLQKSTALAKDTRGRHTSLTISAQHWNKTIAIASRGQIFWMLLWSGWWIIWFVCCS